MWWCCGQAKCRVHIGDLAERRVETLEQVGNILGTRIVKVEGLDTAKGLNPASRLRQRQPHMPAAAFQPLAPQSDHSANGRQKPRGVIKGLARKRFRAIAAGRIAAGVCYAAHGLHYAVETAPLRPGAQPSEGRQGNTHNAGPQASQILYAKTPPSNSPRPISLHEYIRLTNQ